MIHPHSFARVGTHDLLQYFFTVGRDDAHVSPTYRTQAPAAPQRLRRLADAAACADKPLSLFGEIASDPQVLPLLIGLGFQHHNVDIHSLPGLEESVFGLSVDACRQLAARCLSAGNSRDGRAMLNDSRLVHTRSDSGPPRPGQAADATCRKIGEPTGVSLTITRKGRKTRFCSAGCRDESHPN